MPEFILDHGSPKGAATFASLDAFTQGYVEAMFFTDCNADSDAGEGTFAELAPETLVAIVHDCAWFQAQAMDMLQEAYAIDSYSDERAGNDFWYTRNGHGTGFWDRGLGDVGKELTGAAKACGSRDLYRGDDGLLYLA